MIGAPGSSSDSCLTSSSTRNQTGAVAAQVLNHVSFAGLEPVMRLARDAGLHEQVAARVRLRASDRESAKMFTARSPSAKDGGIGLE
jgi:hypothetical protein